MAMRNALIVAVGFIVVMGMALIFFDEEHNHDVDMPGVAAADDSLIGARKAYWAGDIAQAESLYSKITTTNTDNINAWGELGNLYYMQARWKDAATAYTEVALLLIAKNDMQQAAYFHGVVVRLDRVQSERIYKRLRSVSMASETKS